MKKSMKVLAMVMALVLMVSAFAACGSDTDVAKTPAVKVININLTEEEYAFGVDKNQPELLEQVNAFIAEIKENGKMEEIFNKYFKEGTPTPVTSAALDETKDQLVVATNAEFPPFEYTEGDQYLGVDMEIAYLLAQKLGKELVIQNMDFDAVCLSVGSHKCDIAMAGLTINEERKESVTFSDSYYQASQKLIVKGDDTTFDDCTTADQVVAKLQSMDSSVKIGFQNGTTGQSYTESTGDFESNTFKVTPVGYQNGALAVQDMVNGNLNYVIIDAAPAQSIADSVNAAA
ncbi:MAG TPA: transporter substrate-binding domain-containing protein [Candidatus Fimenecus excrementavium]|nr:transporter substrate-binding domain-containing protein [Candidatus Fimenecus excrementavium]